MKLLVADDSKVYRQMLRMLLEQWNYEVLLAQDGQEALKVLEGENSPRLAILDCVMPGLSGPEVCQAIRQRKQNYVGPSRKGRDQDDDQILRFRFLMHLHRAPGLIGGDA